MHNPPPRLAQNGSIRQSEKETRFSGNNIFVFPRQRIIGRPVIFKLLRFTQTTPTLKTRINPAQIIPQACLRIADLVFTQRFVAQGSFEEEVEEIIAETELDYQPRAAIDNLHGKIIDVDFRVISAKAETAVLILPSITKVTSQAQIKAKDVFTKFYDLRDWQGQKLAALDDRNSIYKEDDIDRIRDFAQVLPISEPATIHQYLKAA